jgi:hypothetical protein
MTTRYIPEDIIHYIANFCDDVSLLRLSWISRGTRDLISASKELRERVERTSDKPFNPEPRLPGMLFYTPLRIEYEQIKKLAILYHLYSRGLADAPCGWNIHTYVEDFFTWRMGQGLPLDGFNVDTMLGSNAIYMLIYDRGRLRTRRVGVGEPERWGGESLSYFFYWNCYNQYEYFDTRTGRHLFRRSLL